MDKPITAWDVVDLEGYIGEEETSNLEFKDARSLINEDKTKSEIYKDVSAMANAAGGRIIYGLAEDGQGRATALAPIEDRKGLEEWFQQIVNSNIEPKIQGLVIKKIVLPDDRIALVVDVPGATTFAPHQSKPAKQYFRRHNRTVEAMLDHEIRDVMRRSTSPDLYLRYTFEYISNDHFTMRVFYGNVSREPALYSRVDLIFENAIVPKGLVPGWEFANIDTDGHGLMGTVFYRSFMVPNSLPVMAEHEGLIFEARVVIESNMLYRIANIVSAPGFRDSKILQLTRLNSKTVRVADWD